MKDFKDSIIFTSDGTTLLGADDKARIAVILTTTNWPLKHPKAKHGKVHIGFFPDEEIGRQTRNLDLEKFGADFAYTFDGQNSGKLTVETFYVKRAFLEFISNKSLCK